MSREVQQIPPAPRRLLWGPVLWHLWPVAILGLAIVVYGGLWTWMLYLAAGGKQSDDTRLDAAATIAMGRIEAVETSGASYRGARQDSLAYSFVDSNGHHKLGHCFAAHGELPIGHAVEIEYLEQHSYINRVRGGRIGLLGEYVEPAFWILVLPGILLSLYWSGAVLRLRQILRNGDVAVAEILAAKRLRYVIPNMLKVHYSFRDREANLRTGWHWVRERSLLGARLVAGDARLAVIHARRHPERSRLVVPSQFMSQLRCPSGYVPP